MSILGFSPLAVGLSRDILCICLKVFFNQIKRLDKNVLKTVNLNVFLFCVFHVILLVVFVCYLEYLALMCAAASRGHMCLLITIIWRILRLINTPIGNKAARL